MRIDLYEYGVTYDGIKKRVIEFYNMQQTRIKCIRETFEHRNDFLVYRTRFYRNGKNIDVHKDAVKISEVFEPGRVDCLKCKISILIKNEILYIENHLRELSI